MRSLLCNNCKKYSPKDDFDYGCPNCGFSNYTGEFVTVSEFPGVMVMDDIKPYQSMIDGSVIGSRSSHRAHLKQHKAIEIGNETASLLKPRSIPDAAPQQRKELIIAQIASLTHAQHKAFLKRDIDFIKWNTNTERK